MRDKLLINSGGLAMGSPATGSAIKHPLSKPVGMDGSSSTAKKGANGKFLFSCVISSLFFFRELIFNLVLEWWLVGERLIFIAAE